MRRVGIVLFVALAGCGGSGLEGTLQWAEPPSVSGRALSGTVENTTSHSVTLNPKSVRLLDEDGKKVGARVHVDQPKIASGASTALRATWKSGNPVRIDYGSGTLALRSD